MNLRPLLHEVHTSLVAVMTSRSMPTNAARPAASTLAAGKPGPAMGSCEVCESGPQPTDQSQSWHVKSRPAPENTNPFGMSISAKLLPRAHSNFLEESGCYTDEHGLCEVAERAKTRTAALQQLKHLLISNVESTIRTPPHTEFQPTWVMRPLASSIAM